MTNQKEVIIEAKKLKKSFSTGDTEQTIFEDLDLKLYRGDFTIIMGSSGAGKSTLMYSLSGMDRPTAGEVTFCGKAITSFNDDKLAVFRRKNCGFVFQQIYLLDKMSLMDNVLTASALSDESKKTTIARAKELFDLVNIPQITRKKFPSQVSGGQQQRCAIARAVVTNPKLLFADEPTGALNRKNTNEVLSLLTDLNKAGQSILMVTHDPKAALRATRILYLEDGKIIGELTLPPYNPDEEKSRDTQVNAWLASLQW